jgi:hypothetical protein
VLRPTSGAVSLNMGIRQLRCEIALTVRDMRKSREGFKFHQACGIGGDERLGYGFNTTKSINW